MQATADRALERAWEVLESVPDPEIPVVSIRELGILRDVRRADDGQIEVVITPTYSGCPAMSQIAEDVAHALDAAALAPYRIATTLTPAWTTDWITDDAREKLRAYGIAPPVADNCGNCGSPPQSAEQPITFVAKPKPLPAPACPHCGSKHTERLAQFGSTACKALYRCIDCREPFDYFKPY
ncbi:1,2-phenylacetyl-CoA epoxidase subunit PaaD [Paraburkholderia silvatlantica]|uniref:1,2-phenylacetyl-CoA epoxidase subunit PaaD n=1 Tax=Paraburkholderia silvatlantica TaxID=321895 RepID=UPI0037504072